MASADFALSPWRRTMISPHQAVQKFWLIHHFKHWCIGLLWLTAVGVLAQTPAAFSGAPISMQFQKIQLLEIPFYMGQRQDYCLRQDKRVKDLRLEILELRRLSTDDWKSFASEFLGVDDGLASRLDRVKACGNGQVPEVAAAAWGILNDF